MNKTSPLHIPRYNRIKSLLFGRSIDEDNPRHNIFLFGSKIIFHDFMASVYLRVAEKISSKPMDYHSHRWNLAFCIMWGNYALEISRTRCVLKFSFGRAVVQNNSNVQNFLFCPKISFQYFSRSFLTHSWQKNNYGHLQNALISFFLLLKITLTCKMELEELKIIILTRNKKFCTLELFLITTLPNDSCHGLLVLEISGAQFPHMKILKIYENQ